MLQNSNTCHENVRFVNCLICSTLQLALQNRQYLSTEEFFSPDLVDMNHNPNSPRAKKKTRIVGYTVFCNSCCKTGNICRLRNAFRPIWWIWTIPQNRRGRNKTKIHSMKKMEELGPTLLSHFFFSSFQNVIRNIIYGAARTNITISSDDNTYKIIPMQNLMAREKKLPRGYNIQSTSIVVAQKLTPKRGRQF